MESRPLIAHVVHRLDIGGLEAGLINLVNNIAEERYRHAIVCLTDYTSFSDRIRAGNVVLHSVGKREGKDPRMYLRLWRLLRTLDPAIVHTRNLATIDALVPAWLAGVGGRIHGEHGRVIADPDGTNPKYLRLRRLLSPLTDRYIAVSQDLAQWLCRRVGVSEDKVIRIYNGVDCDTYHPPDSGRESLPENLSWDRDCVVIGCVGRMDPIKDQLTLIQAFGRLVESTRGTTVRLVHIGDGELREAATSMLEQAGLGRQAWLPGSRNDVPALLRAFDVFVLPSRGEGISNTLLEAMATGLPAVATRVGGNPEVVRDGVTGTLVDAGDPEAMAMALSRYVEYPTLRESHGRAGRRRVEEHFSLSKMVGGYTRVYDDLLSNAGYPSCKNR